MIFARAIIPDPDREGRTVAIDRMLRNEDEFDQWADYSPEAVAAIRIVSDNRPIPPGEVGRRPTGSHGSQSPTPAVTRPCGDHCLPHIPDARNRADSHLAVVGAPAL
jgi:hypothetical protein